MAVDVLSLPKEHSVDQHVMVRLHGFFSCSPAAPSIDQRALYIFGNTFLDWFVFNI